MTNLADHIRETVGCWIWGGFVSEAEARETLPELGEPGDEAECVRVGSEALAAVLAQKQEEALTWPAATDCDVLDEVFFALGERGVLALHNAGYTMSDGFGEVGDALARGPKGHYHGFCFYHGQDMERAIDGEGLMLAFGHVSGREDRGLEVGRQVADALKAAGLGVDWDGTFGKRIDLTPFDWKRRGPPDLNGARPARPFVEPLMPARAVAPPPQKPWWKIW